MTDLFGSYSHSLDAVEWHPTRTAAVDRLRVFIPNAGRAYAANRNFDLGADDRSNISALSPWLRHRLITEWDVLSATLSAHGYNAADKFIQEVFWRGYFKGWLQHRPQVWRRYQKDVVAYTEQLNADHVLRERYERARQGQTGIDAFDHWAQELPATGYLHNHARMWFASIWIYTLELPWQLGADFFTQHLLDWDPASNTLSWRWVAGLHTAGKTYLARPNNIARYTNGRFNPAGQLATDAPSLSEEPIQGPVQLSTLTDKPKADGPCVLLITEEDAHFDPLDFQKCEIAGVIALSNVTGRSPHQISKPSKDFTTQVLAEAVQRTSLELSVIHFKAFDIHNWAAPLSDFAMECGVKDIVVLAPPTGPTQDALSKAMPTLNANGLSLHQYQRQYDQLVWPHAKKGFFGLKKQVPTILSTLGLND